MSKQLIGAVAIEDEEISFLVSPLELSTGNLYGNIKPIKCVGKPVGGYNKAFIRGEIKKFFETTSGEFAAIGISMFGVIDAENRTVLSVPSRDWCKAEFVSENDSSVNLNFESIFRDERWKNTSISVCNDATAAALGESSEHEEGNRDGGGVFAYVRVGAGINAGVLRHGRPLRHRLHPEVGHIRPMRHFKDLFPGCCGFHKNCFEGLASLPALIERAGRSLSELDEHPEHEAWDIQAYYLAQLCTMLNMIVAPNCIVLGGSGMRDHIYDRIRKNFEVLVGNYPRYKQNKELSSYIRPARIKNYASLRGALWLAQLDADIVNYDDNNTKYDTKVIKGKSVLSISKRRGTSKEQKK
jgi:fructokinase